MSSNYSGCVLSQTVHLFKFARKMDIFSIRLIFSLLFLLVLSWTGQYTTKTTTKFSLVEEKNEEKKGAKNAAN